MLTDETMGYMLMNMDKHNSGLRIPEQVKGDVPEKEALEIFNEMIDVLKSHKVSYECACRLSIALSSAFISGAVELYNQESV